MIKFHSQDDKEQFEEKVALIAQEELKELKKREFIQKIMTHPRVIIRRNMQIDDYDYQMDVDTELSLTNQ